MIYALIGCLVIIGFLGFKLSQKQKIDKTALNNYKEEISQATRDWKDVLQKKSTAEQDLNNTIKANQYYEKLSTEYSQKVKDAEQRYNSIVNERMKEVDDIIEDTTKRRMEQLRETCEEAKSKYELQLKEYEEKRLKQTEDIKASCIEAENQYFEECKKIKEDTEQMRQQYEALLEPIKQYLKDKQEKYFYTIQLPEEFRDDIEFLLTTVAAKVQHPDIISKLVWAEYVKPNLDNTFKRIEIKPDAGIYKLTSLETGMSYIGKSTNVKNRIADHFKSSIGIKSIADQAVHHAILKEGFWNWAIEVITYTDKDKLNELEKYYIEFFKTQEFGYNKNSGGGG